MARYIYDRSGWPDLEWSKAKLADQLAHVRHRQGRLLGRMDALGFSLREEAALRTLTEDVLKSSEIEGEILDKAQVRSSIARRLGIDIGALTPRLRKSAAGARVGSDVKKIAVPGVRSGSRSWSRCRRSLNSRPLAWPGLRH